LGTECAQGCLFVRKIREHRVQVGHVQYFPSARAKVHGMKLGIILPRRIQAPYQLADSRTVEIRNVPKIQKDALTSILEKIHQEFMNRLPFDQCEPAAYVHNRYVSQLPRAGAETHRAPPIRLCAVILPQAPQNLKIAAERAFAARSTNEFRAGY
jgi:hypothetical protein